MKSSAMSCATMCAAGSAAANSLFAARSSACPRRCLAKLTQPSRAAANLIDSDPASPLRISDHARARRVPQDQAVQGHDHQRDGPKGHGRRRLKYHVPHWEEATGGKVNVAEVPIETLHHADLLRPLERPRQVRRLHDRRLVLRRLLRSQGALHRSGREIHRRSQTLLLGARSVASLRCASSTHGTGRSTASLFDGDAQALYYRKDVFGKKENQDKFKAKYNYDLPAPPKTTKEYHDVADFFTGWDWNGDGAERLGHFAARQGQRAGLLPLPDLVGAVHRLAGQQVLLLQSRHDEAADQFGGPRAGARGLREVPRQRSEGGDLLDAWPGLEPVPRRPLGDRTDLGRSADTRPGSEDLKSPGQDGRRAAARHDGGLQSDHRPVEEVRPQSGRQHQRRHLALRDLAPVEEAGGDLRFPRLHGEQEERLVQLPPPAGPACSPA